MMNTKLHADWKEHTTYLERCFSFKTYTKTMSFVNAVAWVAGKRNHHPDMIVSYNKCVVKITTHDAASTLTEKDYLLAQDIDSL
jgi:4a-hydroxytetrahydrobiopterin dehydratase